MRSDFGRDGSGLTGLKYEERPPASARLKPFVKCIWTLRRTYAGPEEAEVLWPDECKEIIVHHGCVYRCAGRELPASFVMGTLSGFRRLETQGTLVLYGIRLHPWGLHMITDKPVRQFNDRFVPLAELSEALDAGRVAALERSVMTGSLDDAQPRLESFLEALIDPVREEPVLFAVLARLAGNPAEYGVADAVRDSGLSQRQFERLCMKVTGLSPKRLHKIARFNRVRLALLLRPDRDLNDLMAEAGYYDYSHFSKDFRSCMGMTPAQFKTWARRLAADQGPDVGFLQDKDDRLR